MKQTLLALCCYYVCILALVCLYLCYRAHELHSADVVDFHRQVHQDRKLRKEGMMSLNEIGRQFKVIGEVFKKITDVFTEMPKFFGGFSARLLALNMASEDFAKGMGNKEKVLQTGAETAVSYLHRNFKCFMDQTKGCKAIMVVDYTLALIGHPFYVAYHYLFFTLLQLDPKIFRVPYALVTGYLQGVFDFLKTHLSVVQQTVDWYNSCYECNALSNKEIDYNMDTVIPLLNRNAGTYFERAKCQVKWAMRPIEI